MRLYFKWNFLFVKSDAVLRDRYAWAMMKPPRQRGYATYATAQLLVAES
jgi:hypothetical protein